MTTAAAHRPRDEAVQHGLLWLTAAGLAVALHGGGVLWALRQPAAPMAAPAAPPAVMIDLAPEPTAPPSEVDDVAPDLVDAEKIEALGFEPVPTPQPEVPDLPPPPLPAPPPPLEAPPVIDAPVTLPTLQVERPVARPPQPKPVEAPAPPRETPPPAPAKAAVRAKVQAPPAPTVAAPATSVASSGSVTPARWKSRLMAHLERRKRYPAGARRRGEEGVAQVHFSIDAGGNVLSARIVRSSGHAELDEAVLALVRRASPVPAPPPGAPHAITAPVQFSIR